MAVRKAAWASLLLAAAAAVGVSSATASGPPVPHPPAALTAAMRVSARLAQEPILMTSATCAQVWYAPKSAGPVRRLLAGWLAHARPQAVATPPLRSSLLVLNGYVGPAIVYLGWGPGQVTIKPANYFTAGPGHTFHIQYLPGIAALTQDGRTTYWKAPALVRWMRAGRWLPLFTLATAADFPSAGPGGQTHSSAAAHAEVRHL